MSDSSDDMECDWGRLFCKDCEEHFSECTCEEEE